MGQTEENFCVLDVETSATRAGAICQLGLACFEHGEMVDLQSYLIRPEGPFETRFTKVHGISNRDIKDAPTWLEIYPRVAQELHGRTIVSHTMFDRRQVFAACCRNRFTMFSYRK